MRIRIGLFAVLAIGLVSAASIPLLVKPGEILIESTDMVANARTGIVEIGSEEANREVYFSVLVGGVESANIAIDGTKAHVHLIASDNYENRAVQIYRSTSLTGAAVSISYAAGADTQYVAAFKVIGYQPVSGDAWVTKRRTGNDTLTRTLTLSVPAEGAVLLHGKRYDGFSDAPAGTIVDEIAVGEGMRGFWINDTGSEANASFTFTASVKRSEKYAAALVMEKSTYRGLQSLVTPDARGVDENW